MEALEDIELFPELVTEYLANPVSIEKTGTGGKLYWGIVGSQMAIGQQSDGSQMPVKMYRNSTLFIECKKSRIFQTNTNIESVTRVDQITCTLSFF